jgi:hypothetical protein
MKKIIVVIGGTLCAITGACAGLLYLELPAEYPASMVENATPEDEVVLLKLVKDKLTTLENDYAGRRALAEFTFDALAHEETARHPAYAEFSTRGLS